SDSKFTFFFPLLCKFRCPGIAGLDMAYISNMDIIKGGESNDICFWQRPNIVDIRFTISGLYSTMIAENSKESKSSDPNRPTLKSFLDIMKGYTKKPRTNFE